jgi:hypothetical protein
MTLGKDLEGFGMAMASQPVARAMPTMPFDILGLRVKPSLFVCSSLFF